MQKGEVHAERIVYYLCMCYSATWHTLAHTMAHTLATHTREAKVALSAYFGI